MAATKGRSGAKSPGGTKRSHHKSKYESPQQCAKFRTQVAAVLKANGLPGVTGKSLGEDKKKALEHAYPMFALHENDFKTKRDPRPYVQAREMNAFQILFDERKAEFDKFSDAEKDRMREVFQQVLAEEELSIQETSFSAVIEEIKSDPEGFARKHMEMNQELHKFRAQQKSREDLKKSRKKPADSFNDGDHLDAISVLTFMKTPEGPPCEVGRIDSLAGVEDTSTKDTGDSESSREIAEIAAVSETSTDGEVVGEDGEVVDDVAVPHGHDHTTSQTQACVVFKRDNFEVSQMVTGVPSINSSLLPWTTYPSEHFSL